MTMLRIEYRAWLKAHFLTEQTELRYGTLEHKFGVRVWYDKWEIKVWLQANGINV